MTYSNVKTSLKKWLCLGAVAVLSVGTASVAVSFQASAQQAEGQQFGSKAGEPVLEAQNLMTSNNFSAAASKLNEVLLLPELNSYEKSTIYQMLGACYYEMNQYGPAISNFENAINAGGLQPSAQSNLRVNIAQLMIGNGQYAQGAQMLENHLNNGGQQKPQQVEMLMQAWVQSENYSRAMPWAEKWFRAANPKERKHFDLLNFLYNNLNQPGRQADIVKEMIVRWPNDKQLWDNWGSLLANGGREEEAFEVNKMLYLGGVLTSENDLLKVVQYYSYYDMPFQAAQILEKELNAGRISRNADRLVQLSDLFRQAREYKRAIPVLEQAANSSGKAKLFADLGEALYNEGDCVKAEGAFKEAINRGFNAGKSWMLIATCRYEDAQKAERPVCAKTTREQRENSTKAQKSQRAIEAFNKVPSASKEGRDAKKWISFIQAEGKAIEDRCEFEADLKVELCNIKIKAAYDNEVFTGKWEIQDQACLQYKPAYDKAYRKKKED